MNLWSRWKGQWRRLEKSVPVRLVKRRTRQLFGTELRHFVQVRVQKERYGGWTVSPQELQAGSTVYSFGVGCDVAFELALIDRYGVEVHAFDPTPVSIAWVAAQQLPRAFHFHAYGVANYDGVARFNPPEDPKNSYTMLERPATAHAAVTAPVYRLATILAMLGHARIDLLKLDVEGMEYIVIDELVAAGIDVSQLLVEFHHRWRSVGQARTKRAVAMLGELGYRIFDISTTGSEYSFLRLRATW
jgi:FkbM family methyltransferase